MAISVSRRGNKRGATVTASRWDWLDFDEDESRQVRDFLSQQAEGEGVDPLRIGASVRDAMADKLFPGTSTQYTRLRYAILAPALLAKPGVTLEGLSASQAALNTHLASANKGETGVIGRRKPYRDFVRLYWSAIARWKLVVPVSGDERDVTVENGWKAFHRAVRVDEDGSPITQARVRWDTELVELVRDCWKANGWKKPAIACTKAEADYLLRRWAALEGEPVLAAMASRVRKGHPVSDARFPWDAPLPGYPGARGELQRAKTVSFVCWSAHLAYNLALIERARALGRHSTKMAWQIEPGRLDATQAKVNKLLQAWNSALEKELPAVQPWTAEAAWGELGDLAARRFLGSCAARLTSGKTDLRSKVWAKFVAEREKCANPVPRLANDRQIATWTGTPEMAGRWDFRWKSCVRRFMEDAETGLG